MEVGEKTLPKHIDFIVETANKEREAGKEKRAKILEDIASGAVGAEDEEALIKRLNQKNIDKALALDMLTEMAQKLREQNEEKDAEEIDKLAAKLAGTPK